LTVRLRPPKSLPCMPVTAALASSGLDIVTNAKPRERPVTRSEMMATSVTVPWAEKTCLSSSSVAENGRFPT